MKIQGSHSDEAIVKGLAARLQRQRLERNLTQAQLAHEAGVSKRTVERFEAGESLQLTNLIRMLRVLGLGDNLELLIPESTPGPIERLRLRGEMRRRASGRRSDSKPGGWSWGTTK
jgi:transcriptional regulator with XRE-family HTH domain